MGITPQITPVQNERVNFPDSQLSSSDAIYLAEVSSHPNLTYWLRPRYDDRYFGTNIFNLTINKIQGPALDIIIPVGQFLNSSKKELQNFTIAMQVIINLTDGIDSNTTFLTVYCINVQGDVPTRTDNYTIDSGSATGNLSLVINYIATNDSIYDMHYTQLAVWAASDGPKQIPSGYIYNNTEVAWANDLLLAAGTTLHIPDVSVIPSFGFWFLIISLGIILLPYRRLKRGTRR